MSTRYVMLDTTDLEDNDVISWDEETGTFVKFKPVASWADLPSPEGFINVDEGLGNGDPDFPPTPDYQARSDAFGNVAIRGALVANIDQDILDAADANGAGLAMGTMPEEFRGPYTCMFMCSVMRIGEGLEIYPAHYTVQPTGETYVQAQSDLVLEIGDIVILNLNGSYNILP